MEDGKRVVELAKESELRLEVPADKTTYVTLVRGTAEVFGAALDVGDRLALRDRAVAVFTWAGATLELSGDAPAVAYESAETPMAAYLNLHETLEARRAAAARAPPGSPAAQGPRLLLAGPTDAGKSTLCRLLLNYAVRAGSAPTYVDLDVGQGGVTVPGCVAATPVEAPLEADGPSFAGDAPLAYYFGHTSPSENGALYRHLVERLAAALEARGAGSPAAAAAGWVVNSMGWVEDLGYELLLHAAAALRADAVAVVGSERLAARLAADLRAARGAGGAPVAVLRLPVSGGVVARAKEARAAARARRVEEYFYGAGRELAPAAQTARLDDLDVYRVGGGPRAPASALPVGAASVADPLRVAKAGASAAAARDLLYTLVAVSHAAEPDLLLSANVAGFVYVQDVDAAAGTLTYLAPAPGPLPGRHLLAGGFKTYLE